MHGCGFWFRTRWNKAPKKSTLLARKDFVNVLNFRLNFFLPFQHLLAIIIKHLGKFVNTPKILQKNLEYSKKIAILY